MLQSWVFAEPLLSKFPVLISSRYEGGIVCIELGLHRSAQVALVFECVCIELGLHRSAQGALVFEGVVVNGFEICPQKFNQQQEAILCQLLFEPLFLNRTYLGPNITAALYRWLRGQTCVEWLRRDASGHDMA